MQRLALAVPCAYHGAWNLGAAGAAFWAASGLPPALRFVVGAGELAAALALVTGLGARLAAALLVPVFLGAVAVHAPRGFSFKDGGYEPPLVYALLAASFALAGRPRALLAAPPRSALHAASPETSP